MDFMDRLFQPEFLLTINLWTVGKIRRLPTEEHAVQSTEAVSTKTAGGQLNSFSCSQSWWATGSGARMLEQA